MLQISEIDLTRMNNGAHFTFMENIIARIADSAKVKSTCGSLVTDLETAFAEEDSYLNVSRKNMKTDDITSLDAERDRLYRSLRYVVKAFNYTGMDDYTAHAKVLWQSLKDYNIDPEAQMDKESGLLTNLLADIEGRHAAHIAPLALTALVTRLREANEQIKSILRSRTDDRRGFEPGALKAARLKTDKAYRTLVLTVNAYAIVQGEADYAPFIDGVNLEIQKFRRDVLGQKGGTPSTSASASAPDAGTGGTGGDTGTGGTTTPPEEKPGTGDGGTSFD